MIFLVLFSPFPFYYLFLPYCFIFLVINLHVCRFKKTTKKAKIKFGAL